MSSESQRWNIPEAMTEPCLHYFFDNLQALTFFVTAHKLAESYDELVNLVPQDPGAGQTASGYDEMLRVLIARGGGAVQTVSIVYDRLASEMFFTRAVDGFLAYISDLMALMFHAKPGLLGKSTVTMEEVLQHATAADLLATVVERKVYDLSREGMKKLSEYVQRNYDFALFRDAASLEQAVYINEIRNLIVHQRGIVNRKFLRLVPHRTEKVGEKLNLTQEDFSRIESLNEVVTDIDSRAVGQFKLERPFSNNDLWQLMLAIRVIASQQSRPE